MTRFEVWAPGARRVELALADGRVEMRRADGGWWQRELGASAETDYAFVLDGSEPLPDPRSRWQPSGVLGFSRSLDHSRYLWRDEGFTPQPLSRAVFYELHVGTFSPEGTFAGASARLDALRELGVTHVELMPVAAFSGEYGWGYDGVVPFAPHPAYGSPDALKELVDACHARGLAVVFDVVHNHLGPEGNVLPRFGPYFRASAETGWGTAPNFDGPDSDEVRRYFVDSALAWLRDYHGDGLRLDAVHAIVDRSPLPFLEELASAVDALALALGRPLLLVAESDANDPRLVRGRRDGGTGLDAMWSDDFHHALHALVTGERTGYYADFGSCAHVVDALAHGLVYAGRYSAYRRRRHGRADRALSGSQLVAFLQNHDQVGNRARGDRLGSRVSFERLQVLAGLLLTAPFVPLLFQGEEWACSAPFPFFCDYRDPELRAAVSDGRRAALRAASDAAAEPADPCARETFLSAKLDWDQARAGRHQAMSAWYRTLIELRRRCRWLGAGRLLGPDVRCSEKESWISLRRGPLCVIAHFGSEAVSLPLDRSAPRTPLVASREDFRISGDRIELGPELFLVLGPDLPSDRL
ncbi:MAG TPA: malto-oligosyltrehalose trehalohydrolase [Myxococcota bacterium]|nr:malto-oligosyltrehalose trehalohydrolase [Myxococcota bacterium]